MPDSPADRGDPDGRGGRGSPGLVADPDGFSTQDLSDQRLAREIGARGGRRIEEESFPGSAPAGDRSPASHGAAVGIGAEYRLVLLRPWLRPHLAAFRIS